MYQAQLIGCKVDGSLTENLSRHFEINNAHRRNSLSSGNGLPTGHSNDNTAFK
jgi:hypothetical protein